MIKGKRTIQIEALFNGEIKELIYEEYIGSTGFTNIRTFAVLNDDFNTKIKLEELGIKTPQLINELEKENYSKNNHTLLLKK